MRALGSLPNPAVRLHLRTSRIEEDFLCVNFSFEEKSWGTHIAESIFYRHDTADLEKIMDLETEVFPAQSYTAGVFTFSA
jgi:hypothetical protein